ncbi:hypothetical protein CEXT_746961 [Caerostris extrusa]|uniref:Uncharacterized protein n=1 Tax=Caerostris extrusa TaxID=172846 RepID=A0AAV4SKE8_CAEEX|nr:hypothetical protein CEXT_746961 [Caerostris extrusa]
MCESEPVAQASGFRPRSGQWRKAKCKQRQHVWSYHEENLPLLEKQKIDICRGFDVGMEQFSWFELCWKLKNNQF